MMRSHVAIALIGLMLFALACSPDPPIVSTPAPAPQGIKDSGPYICKLIPEQAFRLVSGMAGTSDERTGGNERNGHCWAPDTDPYPLEVWWMQEGPGMSEELLEDLSRGRRELYTQHEGVPLPADLGDGMAAHLTEGLLAQQPYQVSAKFRCGGKKRMIHIFLTTVASGRDAIKDLTDLMRVAQNRYAAIYDCDLAR